MKAQIVLVLLLMSLGVSAQEEHPWMEALNEVMTLEDAGTTAWEDTYQLLCEQEQHPMDLNTVTREQLEQLPFLTAQQVEELVEYLYRYGPMRSLAELRMIRSLDNERRRLLTFFVGVEEGRREGVSRNVMDVLGDALKNGHHELMATARIPFYERKGDRNDYLGYPYRHWLRYGFSYGDCLKAGLVGSQDAGEPFFAHQNKFGYDYYSLYLQLRNVGCIEALVLGCYKVSLGMGLTVNSSFSLGKVAMLQNLGRAANTLRAHSSRSEADYLQGAAATVRLSKGLTATAFASYRGQDATLNKDGTAATIITSG